MTEYIYIVIGSSLTTAVVYKIVERAFPSKNRNNGKYSTTEQHDKECALKLEPIKTTLAKIEKITSETHDAVIEMKANINKRNGD